MRKFFRILVLVSVSATVVCASNQEARKLPKTVEFNGKEIAVPNPVAEEGWVPRSGNQMVVLRDKSIFIVGESDKKEEDVVVGRAEEFLRFSGLKITGQLAIIYSPDSKEPIMTWWTLIENDGMQYFTILFQEDGKVITGTDGGSEPVFKNAELIGVRHFVISDGKRIAERECELPAKKQVAPKKD